jgi:hypothetical protein
MAVGMPWQPGGVMAPADVPNAGEDAWARVSGVPAISSIVGGPGTPDDPYDLPYNVDRARGRIVTNDATNYTGPQAGPGVNLLDDWRDAINPQSPIFWLLLLALGVLGLMQFRVMARVGRARASAALG